MVRIRKYEGEIVALNEKIIFILNDTVYYSISTESRSSQKGSRPNSNFPSLSIFPSQFFTHLLFVIWFRSDDKFDFIEISDSRRRIAYFLFEN